MSKKAFSDDSDSACFCFKCFASSASARLCLKQVHCFGKQEVGHTDKVLSEWLRCYRNVF